MPATIKLKRLETASETPQEAPEPSKDREKLRELRNAQLEGERFIADGLIRRIGKGVAVCQEKGWEWQEPDWEADPDSWTGLPKLLLVINRLDQSFRNLWWLNTFTEKPLWCDTCENPEKRPAGFVVGRCNQHLQEAEMVRQMATSLGWRTS